MSTWVKITVGTLQAEQLQVIADLVNRLHKNWEHFGLVEPAHAEASYAPDLVFFVHVSSDDGPTADKLARTAVWDARSEVEHELHIGEDGFDPLNSAQTVADAQFQFDPGYRRIGHGFVRSRPGAIGRIVNELEFPAQVLRGAVWSVARGTSSRAIIPSPPEADPELPSSERDTSTKEVE
jgi:hypothetical protein